MAECAVPECPKSASRRGWCEAHYRRWRKHGDPLHGGPLQRQSTPPDGLCTIPGCDKPARKRGMCNTHADRVRHYGDPFHGHQPQDGANNHNWRGDAISYGGMHVRLKRMVGRAKDFTCVDCGSSADDWSYIGPCPDERINAKGRPWCAHIECYTTRCRSCHTIFDARRNRAI